MVGALSPGLIERLRERASNPARRSDSASLTASSVPLDSLLGQIGQSNPQLQAMQGMMGQFADIMKGFGVVAPMPANGRAGSVEPEPSPAPATGEQIAAAEQALGRRFPVGLAQLYGEIADGGFGPCSGLFSLVEMVDAYHEMTREPAGPGNQAWPANLVPLVDAEPGYDCIDFENGAVVFWDPEELDSYSNAAWMRSFKPAADSLANWLEEWLQRPSASEHMQQQREEIMRNPMEIHIKNMIESYGRMSAEERAQHGLPGDDWEAALRRRFER